jgi:hypothetical protein
MPSPKYRVSTVSIVDDSGWLTLVQNVRISGGILPGQNVRINEDLRVLIIESKPHSSGQQVHQTVSMKPRADFERLARSLSRFHSNSGDWDWHTVDIQYPLKLDVPKCLDSVMAGDRVKISWTVCCL